MLITMREILNCVRQPISGVLSIGACEGEDYSEYLNCGISNICFIEANHLLIPTIKQKVNSQCPVLQGFLWDKDGEYIDFRINYSDDFSNKGCSSGFEMSEEFKQMYPMIKERGRIKLKTTTLDFLLKNNYLDSKDYDFLNMDVQGAELKVLKGATETLKNVRVIMTEYATKPLYEGGVLKEELLDFLVGLGFHPVIEKHVEDSRFEDAGWGDLVMVRS